MSNDTSRTPVSSDAGRFAIIPLWMIERLNEGSSTGAAISVLAALHQWIDDDKYGYPSHASIGKRANISTASVKRGIKALEGIGALVVVPRWIGAEGKPTAEKPEGKPERTSNGYFIRYAQPLSDPTPGQSEPHPLGQSEPDPSGQIRPSKKNQFEVEPFELEIAQAVEIAEVVPEWQIEFEQFYALYPRKKAKDKALIVWKKLKDEHRRLALKAIHEHVAYWEEEQTGQKFIPHPATWLNQKRWDDVLVYEAPKGKNNPVLEHLARKYQSEHRASDPDTRQTDRGDNRLGRSSVGNLSIEVHSTD
jgi:hypothetical protein